jgi:hypothetical protein
MFGRLRPTAALLAVLAALLGAPASAGAASRVIAPPGNSGVGQYVEVVPTAGGGAPVGSHQSGKGAALPASTVKRLNGLGPDGKALAAFAQQTGTPGNAARRSSLAHSKSPSSTGPQILPPASALRAASPGAAGGLGLGLPIALGAIALAAAAMALGRRLRTAG